jgi:hypothetical protein
LRDPRVTRVRLLQEVWGLSQCTLLWGEAASVGYLLQLEPWVELRDQAYPTERVALLVLGTGSVFATPHDQGERPWRHRYGWAASDFRELCLWDPTDAPALRWTWADGLVAYVSLVHRHVQAEEFARRHGAWPAEDSPHGPGPHPVQTAATRRAAARWAR